MASQSRDLKAFVRRFDELTQADQLAAYELIRDFLVGDGRLEAGDPILEARFEALSAMRRVLAHYGIEDPRKLGAKQFDAAPEDVRIGWRSGQIIRVWAKWRFAQTELIGGRRARPTLRQRAVLRGAKDHRPATAGVDEWLGGVRAWLATKPPRIRTRDYEEWERDENHRRIRDGLQPWPSLKTMKSALDLSWEEVLRVARREAEVSELSKMPVIEIAPYDPGEVVTRAEIEMATGLTRSQVFWRLRRGGVTASGRGVVAAYSRSEVEACLGVKLPLQATGDRAGDEVV